MEIYVKTSFISIFSFFPGFKTHAFMLILPVSPLQTHLVMTSQVRSHIKYLIQFIHVFI